MLAFRVIAVPPSCIARAEDESPHHVARATGLEEQ